MRSGSSHLTSAQLEILSMFKLNFSEEELRELKNKLKDFLAEKAIKSANKNWKEKGWSDKKVNALLKSHLRTPYVRFPK